MPRVILTNSLHSVQASPPRRLPCIMNTITLLNLMKALSAGSPGTLYTSLVTGAILQGNYMFMCLLLTLDGSPQGLVLLIFVSLAPCKVHHRVVTQ